MCAPARRALEGLHGEVRPQPRHARRTPISNRLALLLCPNGNRAERASITPVHRHAGGARVCRDRKHIAHWYHRRTAHAVHKYGRRAPRESLGTEDASPSVAIKTRGKSYEV